MSDDIDLIKTIIEEFNEKEKTQLENNITEDFLGMKGISAARFNNLFKNAIFHTFKVHSENELTAQRVREVSAGRIARIIITHMKVSNKFIFVISGTASQKSRLRNILILSNIESFVRMVAPTKPEKMTSFTNELYIISGTRKSNDHVSCQLVKALPSEIVGAVKQIAKHSLVAYNITVEDEKKEELPFLILDLLPIFRGDEDEEVENVEMDDVNKNELDDINPDTDDDDEEKKEK